MCFKLASLVNSAARHRVQKVLTCFELKLKRIEIISPPKLRRRRRRVFQAFSVPGAEQLRKLLSVGH